MTDKLNEHSHHKIAYLFSFNSFEGCSDTDRYSTPSLQSSTQWIQILLHLKYTFGVFIERKTVKKSFYNISEVQSERIFNVSIMWLHFTDIREILIVYVKIIDIHDKQTISGLISVHVCDHSILYFSLVTNNSIMEGSMYWTVQASWFFLGGNI